MSGLASAFWNSCLELNQPSRVAFWVHVFREDSRHWKQLYERHSCHGTHVCHSNSCLLLMYSCLKLMSGIHVCSSTLQFNSAVQLCVHRDKPRERLQNNVSTHFPLEWIVFFHVLSSTLSFNSAPQLFLHHSLWKMKQWQNSCLKLMSATHL